MDSISLCICSTRRYRCCKNEKEAQDAQQFQSFFFGSCDIVRVMLTSLTDLNNFPKLAKHRQNNVDLWPTEFTRAIAWKEVQWPLKWSLLLFHNCIAHIRATEHSNKCNTGKIQTESGVKKWPHWKTTPWLFKRSRICNLFTVTLWRFLSCCICLTLRPYAIDARLRWGRRMYFEN